MWYMPCMYSIFTSNTYIKFIYIYHIVDFHYRWLTDKRALIEHSKNLTIQFSNIYVIIWQEFRQVTRYIQCVMLSRTIDHMLCYTESYQIYKSCTVKQLFFFATKMECSKKIEVLLGTFHWNRRQHMWIDDDQCALQHTHTPIHKYAHANRRNNNSKL